MKWLLALGLVTLAACAPTVDEVRARAPSDVVYVPERFDELATCLAARLQAELGHPLSPLISQRQQTATILLATAGNIGGEILIVPTEPSASRVTLRQRPYLGGPGGGSRLLQRSLAACVPGWQPQP